MERRFFESHGFSGLQDLAVVVSKYGGLFRREDFLVGFTDEILVGQMGNDFKLTVRLEIASGKVFDENQGWAIVHDRSKSFFAISQCRLCLPALADIAYDAGDEECGLGCPSRQTELQRKLSSVFPQTDQFKHVCL